MTTDDPWSLYKKDVRKLGETEVPAPPKNDGPKKLPQTPTSAPAETKTYRTFGSDVPEAWLSYMGAGRQASPPDLSVKPVREETPTAPPSRTAPTAPTREPLDIKIERNLSLGDVVIEGRLDLHGRTEQDAHTALLDFVSLSRGRGKRVVLVITGKGRDGESVLKTNLPRWCLVPPLEDDVWAVRTAAPIHGGEGAYYLVLRKKNR